LIKEPQTTSQVSRKARASETYHFSDLVEPVPSRRNAIEPFGQVLSSEA